METVTKSINLSETLVKVNKSLLESEHLFTNSSYETGILGLSMHYKYFNLYTGDYTYNVKFEETLLKGIYNLNISNFSKVYKSDSLDNHLSNIGRYLMFLKNKNLINLDVETYLNSLDETMFKLLKSKISVKDFDYNSGALASGYYFLARSIHSKFYQDSLTSLINGIESSAMVDEDGDYYWHSPSLWNNVYFGLSHGSAMIVSFISNVKSLNIETVKCTEILTKACNFLLKHVNDINFGRFPTNLLNKHVLGVKPFCICYGDIGVAYALYKANKHLKDPQIAKLIDLVFDESVERKRQTSYPPDAGITYGASGLAAFFDKLYILTNDARFLSSSRFWCEQIPSFAISDERCAGFRSLANTDYDFWNVSFGWGTVGISLALMRYLDSNIPEYSELLMIV